MLEQFKRLYHEKGVRRFYIGGAMGVHIWAGELVLQLRGQPGYEDIELVVVLRPPAIARGGTCAAGSGWSSC